MLMLRNVWIAGALGAALLAAPDADANGRFPRAQQLEECPGDPSHLVLRATFGVLSTADSATSWSYTCEGIICYGGTEDPSMGITRDGTLLAGFFQGLAVSHDRGCSWSFIGGGLDQRFVVDVTVRKDAPDVSLVLVSDNAAGGKFLNQIWQSPDNGVTWAQLGVDLADDMTTLTLDPAPSNPDIIYVTGVARTEPMGPTPPMLRGVIARTTDAGQSWERFDIPESDAFNNPFLSAIDPNDPDRLYVRTNSMTMDALHVSDDGGKTWSKVLEGQAEFYGFALSPDGATVTAGFGDPRDPNVVTDPAVLGIWRAPTATLSFTKVFDGPIGCLKWTGTGLYACTSQDVHGFELGISSDMGSTVNPLLALPDVQGPQVCPAGPDSELCACEWQTVCAAIGQCSADASMPEECQLPDRCFPASAGGAAGASGSGSGGDGATSTGGTGGTGGASTSDAGPGSGGSQQASGGSSAGGSGDDGGCGCRVPGGRTAGGMGAMLALLLPLAWRLRRRR